MLKDKRYTVKLELCGETRAVFVARFCGEWIGHTKGGTKKGAEDLCEKHNKERMDELCRF